MLSFSKNGVTFNVRASGFLVCGDKILLQRVLGHEEWSLPGGRVELGEVSQSAYHREINEETGLIIHSSRLLIVAENFFLKNDKVFHEISFYYQAEIVGQPPLEGVQSIEPNSSLVYEWHEIAKLAELDVFPRQVVSAYITSLGSEGLIYLYLNQC